MKKRRILAILLTAVMGSAILAGCGESGGGATTKAPDTTTAADKENKEEETEAEKTEKSEAGEETKAAAAADAIEVTMVSPLFEAVPDMTNNWWTMMAEETGITWDIEWIPNNDFWTKLDMLLASAQLPEVLISTQLTRPTLVTAVQQGAFHNLSDYLGDFEDYPNLLNNPTPNAWNYVKIDGSIAGIPRSRPQIDLGIKIRADWLEQLDIPMPTTTEEYKDALIAIVNGDPDGNGQKDTMGLIGFNYLLRDSDGPMHVMFGGRDLMYDDEGGLVHSRLNESYAAYIEFLRELYAGGALASEFSVMSSQQAEDIFLSGMAASYTRNIWRDYTFQEEIRKVQPDAVVDTIPPMAGPDGKTRVALEPGVYGAYYFNSNLPEDRLLRLLDYFETTCSDEWLQKAYFGWEGVHHDVIDGQKTLNETGALEVGTSVQQPIPMIANTWAKVLNPTAPKAFNDAKLDAVEIFGEVGQVDPFQMIVSDAWTNTWPKYEEENEANSIKAIVGQISMEEYREYQEKLCNMPEFKQAFQEYAAAYDAVFG